MNLSTALNEKKAAQNALARLISIREKILFFDKKKKPEIKFHEIEQKINEKIEAIDDFKIRITYTNCHTKLETGINLLDAIIKLGNIRSELKCYSELLDQDKEDELVYFSGRSQVQEFEAQVEKQYLIDKIEELEKQKYELDSLIAQANNSTELVSKIPD